MKQFLVVFILLCNINSFAQDTIRVSKKVEKDYVMLVGYYKNDIGCKHKAIKIFEDRHLFVDSCYDTKNQFFESDREEITKVTSSYMEFYNFSNNEWGKIKEELDRMNCDNAGDFEIHISKKGTKKVYKLKRLTNCYSASIKKQMEKLEEIFKVENGQDFFNR